MILTEIKMNTVTIHNAYILSSIDVFTEDFAGMKISFLIDVFSDYD
ncbi:hypothetical protein ACJ72_08857 [Emergomyces africanus]|uniref:Uncharacterized protein n=1 Tax=Emergomyces africanus TaxID=1955775 RepID=A0A1B7NJK8_9EURO|nr:hypothetical protein ACJ72_08857 [Emergomyces africanus]